MGKTNRPGFANQITSNFSVPPHVAPLFPLPLDAIVRASGSPLTSTNTRERAEFASGGSMRLPFRGNWSWVGLFALKILSDGHFGSHGHKFGYIRGFE